jgi:dihydroxyacetone kinase-like protein
MSAAELTAQDLIATFAHLAERLTAARDELCRLDGQIGDGDHGLAMSDGFNAAAQATGALPADTATLAEVFNAGAKALLNAVGASSGPLYATALIRAGKVAGARRSMPLAETPSLIAAMAEGIRTRGQAAPGEKTMVDAWEPAAQAGTEGTQQSRALPEILASMRDAAASGAKSTETMLAAKGRAARLGERARGHVDPGATSAAMIIAVLTDDWRRLAGA